MVGWFLYDVMMLGKLLGSLVARTPQSEVPTKFQRSVWSSEVTWPDVMAVSASQRDQ